MKIYQIESEINEQGIIVLPEEMKNLHQHRVKVIIVDLETKESEPTDFLDCITDKFTKIEESDLNIDEMYVERDHFIECDQRKHKKKRQFGSARGLIKMADDFDETPEDFQDYL